MDSNLKGRNRVDPLLSHILTLSHIVADGTLLKSPWKAKDIQAIEAIQRTFTYKITEVQHLNYWEKLHKLKLDSLQRRRERYIIFYIWKITQHMVPNTDGTMGHKIKNRKHPRHRTQCVIQYPTNRNPAQSL